MGMDKQSVNSSGQATEKRWKRCIPQRFKPRTSWNRLPPGDPASNEQHLEMDEHTISVDDLCQRLGTNWKTGLTEDQVRHRQGRCGLNKLTPPKKTTGLFKLLNNLFSGFGVLLIIAALICITTSLLSESQPANDSNENIWLGIALLSVAIITASLQYYQEVKSSRIMESFKDIIAHSAIVQREGIRMCIPSEELVVGDLVELKGGDRVPADIRITKSHNFKVDNSVITGESEPQLITADVTYGSAWEATNLLFFSTYALEGTACGIVVRTGDRTMMGTIAQLTSQVSNEKTPIAVELEHFIRIISTVAFLWGALILIACLANGYPMMDSFLYFISTVVANVPEGLLATVTVLLALTAKRMAGKNCLVRRLEAIETLGSTNVICTDKTGTLTQNRMTVSHYWLNECIIQADHSEDKIISRSCQNMEPADLMDSHLLCMLRIAILCNKAEFKPGQPAEIPVLKRECVGDPLDAALLKYAEIMTNCASTIRRLYPKECEIPFNSVDKIQISVHQRRDGYFVAMKGAPEHILSRCRSFLRNGTEQPIDAEFESAFNDIYLKLGGSGERVLGLCDLDLPADQYPKGYNFENEKPNFPTDGMRFVGMISLVDPPRPGAPYAVAKCRLANIKVAMVTGDHPITALSIARSVGIVGESSETVEEIARRKGVPLSSIDSREAKAVVLHGSDLGRMNQDELSQLISTYTEIVFARTSPRQKLVIVETYQRLGYTVAVTGDGVNDAPALKKADVGVAMGITGCDVCKQAADIILMDDNFCSLVTGIEEGRLIFENMKKAITYVLTSNIPELFPFILHVVLNIPLALGTTAILCIDLGTDIWPDISLAYEPSEGDLMKRNARNRHKERLVNRRMVSFSYGQIGVIEAAGAFMAYFVVMNENGFFPSSLPGIRSSWESPAFNWLEDSYGQQWTYAQRKTLENTCHTAYFAAIIVMQWANLICSKTRRNSIIHQGMRNRWLNIGLLFETALATLLIYCPGMDTYLHLQPLKLQWWWPSLPFAVLLFIYDELRRFVLRRNCSLWLQDELTF
uniref:Sodium/potassium-transporting ATPase subunit alpha n=1 Tax=Trichuris muris TaxID=70415 RepID=A0A5S6R0Q8_TRIMR